LSKSFKLLIVFAAITSALVVGIIWFGRSSKAPEDGAQASLTEPSALAPEETNGSSFLSERGRQQATQKLSYEGLIETSGNASNLISGWEDKVDEILGSTRSEADKAKQMLEMFPTLPATGQEEVVRHLTNLLPDQDYGLMRSFLTNASLPENVQDVLLGDVLNRPNSLKLPVLLEVARNPQHSKAAEAKDFLQLFLEQDYGSDWDKWQAGMEQWLKANPD
jgi:hypothetical protein